MDQTQQQIVQQERFRALEQMARHLAHDFNNLLTPILGLSQLLLTRPESLDDKETVSSYLRMINTAAQDMANVIARLRGFYREPEGAEAFAPVSLNDLVRQAITLTQASWEEQAQAAGITISVETDLQDVPPIPGDEAELREMVVNLISNAVDAMPGGGTITLVTRPEGEYVLIEVRDTGTGMAEEARQHCLEPFFTTKGTLGTGLGLAIVYGTVRRHEGSIEIESEAGRGTAFVVRLPIQRATTTKEGDAVE